MCRLIAKTMIAFYLNEIIANAAASSKYLMHVNQAISSIFLIIFLLTVSSFYQTKKLTRERIYSREPVSSVQWTSLRKRDGAMLMQRRKSSTP
jgi:hypothetical protein